MGSRSFVLLQLLEITEMKQRTMHVEWYHGDFSDPEAVSGSSNIKVCFKRHLWCSFLFTGEVKMWCGKEAKNHNYFIQKVVDISEIER